MNTKKSRIIFAVIAVLVILIGFFIPFGIMYGGKSSEKALVNSKSFDKLNSKSIWKLSNSYNSSPIMGKTSIKRTIISTLRLNNHYQVKLFNYQSGVNAKNVSSLSQISQNIYSPKIVYNFDYAILKNGSFIHAGSVDNSWMLSDIMQGIKINYIQLFAFPSNSKDGDISKEINSTLAALANDNISDFSKNVEKNNLGDQDDVPYIFSGINYDFIKINSEKSSFSITNDEGADLLNSLVDIPKSLGIQKFQTGKEYPYFYKASIDSRYEQHLLGLPAANSQFTPDDSFTGDTTIGDVRKAVSKVLTSKAISSLNLNTKQLGIGDDLFDVSFYKYSSPSADKPGTLYSDSNTVSDMWGYGKLKPYAYVHINGLNKKYDYLSSIFSFPDNYTERIWYYFKVSNSKTMRGIA